MVDIEVKKAIVRTLFIHENRMTLEKFLEAFSRPGVGLSELREMQMAQELAEVDGKWIALVSEAQLAAKLASESEAKAKKLKSGMTLSQLRALRDIAAKKERESRR